MDMLLTNAETLLTCALELPQFGCMERHKGARETPFGEKSHPYIHPAIEDCILSPFSFLCATRKKDHLYTRSSTKTK